MDQTYKSELYAETPPVGLLKGFSPVPNQLEVDVIVPFSGDAMPGFGEFLLAALGPNDALVGRVSRFTAAGHLVSPQGDAYLADLAKTDDIPPGPIMKQMLRYNMKMNLLGHIRFDPAAKGTKFQFLVGERAFATLGCRVHRPSEAALAFLCNVGLENDPSAAVLGHLAYGQQVLEKVPVRFSVDRLKGRRSFVFARAGYGKSNLMKYLISQLYSRPPEVGLLIFDPEGEYALPDAEGRPALANVPQLKDRISLYTNRTVAKEYAALRKGEAFIDFGHVAPQDIVNAWIPKEKQEMVFASVLRMLDFADWRALIDLLSTSKHRASEAEIAKAIGHKLTKNNEVIMQAIRNNLVPPVSNMHRAGASLSQDLIAELGKGRIVIVDTSLLPTEDALALSGLILQRVFSYNRKHFTDPAGSIVRCLAVIEEAQTVLGDRHLDDRNIFVRWVKEGRKYGLGCVLVTQQPGSLADQIISQGDNFFVLHLLNDSDLKTLNRHNAYFSEDILSFIRNEPIKGNCFFWSAPDQPFVIPARVADFVTVTDLAEKPPTKRVAETSVKAPARRSVGDLVRQWALDAIAGDNRVWLYPLESPSDHQSWIVLSHDYLANVVAEKVQSNADVLDAEDPAAFLETELYDVLRTTLKGLGGHQGYAVLAGNKRAVWALPEHTVKLADGKSVKSQRVEVKRSL
jgi:hypothetical protein